MTDPTISDVLALVDAANGRLSVCHKHGHPVRRILRRAAGKGLLTRILGGEVYTLNTYGREVLEQA